jgi:hypothetical protein
LFLVVVIRKQQTTTRKQDMKKLTPQQIADATAKRLAKAAFNRANGIPSVKVQRQQAKAAKAAARGHAAPPPPRTAPPPRSTYAPPPPRSSARRPVQPTASAPLFSTPVVTTHGAKLVALAAFEDVVKATFAKGGITDQARSDWDTYKKLKTLAMSPCATKELQNEADTSLRMAITRLLRIAF